MKISTAPRQLWRHAAPALGVLGVALASTGSLQAVELTKEQKAFFEQRIAPILSDSCYKCHSTAEKVKGGLALDSHEGVLKGGDDGKIIVLGHPADSMLYQRVTSKDPDEKMPPKDANLTPQQVADLATWIKMGAPDPRVSPGVQPGYYAEKAKAHWAWQPLRLQPVPAVRNATWCKTPVDNFIEAKLEQHQMGPSEPADRETLIRRAYYDLIGLPPMPWEVKTFVDDKSPNAWEKVVDRLLSSPHYGERWGRYWLDVARYSDTKGDPGKKDTPVFVDAWTYRDYVIDSFNQDKPYDRFILEQLAADKLNLGQDKRPLAGLGFLTVGDRFNGNRNDMINDQIDAVTKGFLGLTVTCARCHDHKFDPIPQKDYYSLHGVFASTLEPKDNPIIAAEGNAKQYQDYLKDRDAALNEAKQFAVKEIEQIRSQFREHAGTLLLASRLTGQDRAKSLRDSGLQPKIAQELLQVVSRKTGFARRDPVFAPWAKFAELPADTFSAKAAGVVAEISSGADARFPMNPMVVALFKDKPAPASIDEVASRYATLFQEVDKKMKETAPVPAAPSTPAVAPMATMNAGPATMKPVITLASAAPSSSMAPASSMLPASAVTARPGQTADANFEELRQVPFKFDPAKDFDDKEVMQRLPQRAAAQFQQKLNALAKIELTDPGAPKRAMVVEDSPKVVNSPVFIRGEAASKGEVVPRRFLEILSGPTRPDFKDGSGRLDLAEAIASRSNPLTARVMVNRIWEHHFGDGFVTTPDDFGTQSAPPSHQELLDYLAMRFMQSGWSMKTIHKLIMLSAVYQQKSDTNPTYANADPNNRLLWRYNIRRLDFEPLRDSLLYIAGKLDLSVGGHPVNILSEPYSTRRSVYGFIDRANLPEMMNHFDFANPSMPLGKRHETTVPQQALIMMNSPLMIEVARCLLARPEMTQAKTDAQKVHALYWMIYQRPPKPEEIELGLGFVKEQEMSTSTEAPPAPAAATAANAPTGKMARLLALQAQKKDKLQDLRKGGGFTLQNEGEKVERKALTPWEKYTHALLMANEAVYFN